MKNLISTFLRWPALVLACLTATLPAGAQDIAGPTGSGLFGTTTTTLPNGNFVVTDPGYDAGAILNVGAVHLYNGITLALISTLTGSTASDQVGNFPVTVLTGSSNFVVRSTLWNASRGAVTRVNGTTGLNGMVSITNSLVGGSSNDLVGLNGVTALNNGNYVVASSECANGGLNTAGAATWCNGDVSTAATVGAVTISNSIMGSKGGDLVGLNGIVALTNGNYVVVSSECANASNQNNAGAVTWGNGSTAGPRTVGTVVLTNSLIGAAVGERIGNGGVIALTNGNYVVSSSVWSIGGGGGNANVGAATWGNGATGIVGTISSTNSLIGSAANDNVSIGGITALPNGNYVVSSPNWNNGGTADAGAATWGNGAGGTVGAVSAANSLVGSTANNQVGSGGSVALTNDNYVVRSPLWDNGGTADVGAVTWGNGAGGTVGAVGAANSLVGTIAIDNVGGGGITALANGNYVVASPLWNNGGTADVGAATWGNGATLGPRTVGAVAIANSLVGTITLDQVSSGGIAALANNNYVVASPLWNNGGTADVGAATWGNGATGTVGAVSNLNSLVGGTANNQVGSGGITALTNNNYVVRSPLWDNGGTADVGAATWGNGDGTTVNVVVSVANSLVGSILSDQVGNSGITALANGNYVVASSLWNNVAIIDAGAMTYGVGTGSTTGPITSANSVLGTVASGINPTFASFGTGARILVGRPASNLATIFPSLFIVWNGTAWSPSVPTATDNASIIGISPSQPPSFVANNLVVQAGVNLSLASGVTATINGSLNYLGNVTVQSGGALLQTTGSTLGTTSGTFTAQRDVASKVGFGYNYISSPVAGQSIGTVLAGNTFTNNRFRHDPTLASGARWIVFSGTMAAGTGYTHLPAAGTGTFNFVGIPNNGNVSTTLTGQAAYRFNVVGNPYPSPLRLGTLFAANNDPTTGISGTAWFWQDNNNNTGTGSYLTLNAVSNANAQVAVGQGFFVQANSNSGTLNFTNAQREAGNPTFYRGEASMERFRLAVSAQGGQDELWVAFGPQFTTGFEKGFDAEKLEGATNLSLSAIVNRERLAIAALPEPSSRFELPLQVFARGAGPCTFTATEVESPTAQKLFLEDRRSGEFYYLQPGRSHTLNLPAGNHRDRFYLRSASEIVGQSTQLGETAGAFAFGRELFVEAGETAEVAVYSTLGTLVQRFANVPSGGLRRLDAQVPASGVYVVKVATATGSVEKRVWLEK